ncbi:tRNA-(ms[2]io[6]A)-hydroxylase [Ferrimonas balearica]|uniref:tRNA-(ms[2]io[6]A)-hydroxylase n=1 Tax=Ferrimonas balearica TaxID=44012 RepID=UPI001C98F31A|nr:tRNA isopentenyl-2-thiomethyl-A-37 hydroxylase MiaE [Ferrimonas balearica]MBY5922136.1 tRNA isopentenyl-2-thiomethyl-A-37 hydroxylase MiaE [Ferrimonas balearica]MBY5994524.1 tRNA isopentenyl-2-thiomethyl-A-37 hydroxylase MiaE [Ferrimonas balearica]
MSAQLEPILQFLHCPTPEAWLQAAIQAPDILLIDHCNCELKAAQAAVRLMRRYDRVPEQAMRDWLAPYEAVSFGRMAPETLLANRPAAPVLADKSEMVEKLFLLVREELHHFEQVLEIMNARGIRYDAVTAARYANGLLEVARREEPGALVDRLIIGAYIEARSCERFAALIPYVDDELASFYHSLLRSEARHYQDYLALAQCFSEEPIVGRVEALGQAEARLIESPDPQLRFHSGIPA